MRTTRKIGDLQKWLSIPDTYGLWFVFHILFFLVFVYFFLFCLYIVEDEFIQSYLYRTFAGFSYKFFSIIILLKFYVQSCISIMRSRNTKANVNGIRGMEKKIRRRD